MSRRALAEPALMPLWRELHRRLSTGRPVASVRLSGLSEAERHAVSELLGKAGLVTASPTISTAALERAIGATVATVVAEIVGPLGDQAAERTARARERAELWDWFETHPVVTAQPVLQGWAREIRAGGVSESVSATRRVLERALTVLRALPAGGLPLPVFAERTLNDPHALDEGRVANLVLRAVATLTGRPEAVDAEGRRELWDAVGVSRDALSSLVWAVGLPLLDNGPLARMIADWSRHGQAVAITLAQLRTSPRLRLERPVDVWVVENPSVLDLAARTFGTACPAMVCTAGWPSSAGIGLLRTLGNACTRLHYHGDFDPAGLRIAGYVFAKTAAKPWSMRSDDYRLAARALTEVVPTIEPADVPDTSWDPELAATMRELRIVVSEERVVASLLDQFAGAGGAAEAPNRSG